MKTLRNTPFLGMDMHVEAHESQRRKKEGQMTQRFNVHTHPCSEHD